jgi:hypothetical protein
MGRPAQGRDVDFRTGRPPAASLDAAGPGHTFKAAIPAVVAELADAPA